MNALESKFTTASIVTVTLASCISFICLFFALKGPPDVSTPEVIRPIIPSRFSIPATFDTPSRIVEHENETWAYAAADLLQALYRNQGLLNNYFNESTFLELSPRALIDYFNGQDCLFSMSHACRIYDQGKKVSAAALHTLISAFPDSTKLMRPSTAKAESASPLIFSLRKPSFAANVYSIKELLYRKKRPLILTMPHIYARYYRPCTKGDCERGVTCPSHIGSKYTCDYDDSDTLLPNGNFFVPVSPAIPYAGNPLNVLLVGYSDNFVPSGYTARFKSQRLPRGGFIVKGYHGTNYGHTIPYFEGVRDFIHEAYSICSTPFNPPQWGTCRADGGNCDHNLLDCVDSQECKESSQYALVRSRSRLQSHVEVDPKVDQSFPEPLVSEDKYGFTTTQIYEIPPDKDPKVKETTKRFWELGFYYKQHRAYSSRSDCGYWFIPYELFEMGAAMGDAMAVDIPVKWSGDSYLKNSTDPMYKDIRESTMPMYVDAMRNL